jgi:hypothetical protein
MGGGTPFSKLTMFLPKIFLSQNFFKTTGGSKAYFLKKNFFFRK